jgi:hypothetical protein
MKLLIAAFVLTLLSVAGASAQNNKHFAKDGLAFDYPDKWIFNDASSQQMQVIELALGDVIIRIRSPREWLKTPEKEAHAKKLIQEKYVNDFVEQLQQAGLQPKRSPATTQIAGADAEGVRVRAILDREPGGMDSYVSVVSDRLVNLSIIGSEKDITRTAPVWDMIRNTLKVEPPPEPKPSPSPKAKP